MVNSCEQGFPSKTNLSKIIKEEYLSSDGMRGVRREARNHTVLHCWVDGGRKTRQHLWNVGPNHLEEPASRQGLQDQQNHSGCLPAREPMDHGVFRDPSAAPATPRSQNYAVPLQLSSQIIFKIFRL